jgi:hypothetical protein
MDIARIGSLFVLIGTILSGLMMLAGYMLDWSRADKAGPGPLVARDQ